jgi:glyoxylase-like metal-dependent hydrolase (beta-lactamase superfamily II)
LYFSYSLFVQEVALIFSLVIFCFLGVRFLLEILEGVHQVNGVNGNVYIVVNGKELTLIDTGLPRNARKILSYVQELGHPPSDISTIMLTHFHLDHVGSALQLKNATKAKVAVHKDDADYVSGKKQPPKLGNLFYRAVSSIIKASPVQPDLVLNEGDKIGHLRVLHTPGHTPGSISVLDEERQALFVGDSLRTKGEKIVGPSEEFSINKTKAQESIGKIAALKFDIMLPGHGEPLRQNASDAVKKFYESLK